MHRQRLRISLPRLNDHAEMDVLGLKWRAVFKFLPCGRMNAFACAHRNLERAPKECGRRQNNPDYSARSLETYSGKIAVECSVVKNPTRQWSHSLPSVRLLISLRCGHRSSRRRDGSRALRCRRARRRGAPVTGRIIPSATSLQNPAKPRSPAPKANWGTHQRTISLSTQHSSSKRNLSVPAAGIAQQATQLTEHAVYRSCFRNGPPNEPFPTVRAAPSPLFKLEKSQKCDGPSRLGSVPLWHVKRGKKKPLVRKRYVVERIVGYGWDSILATPAGRPVLGLASCREKRRARDRRRRPGPTS